MQWTQIRSSLDFPWSPPCCANRRNCRPSPRQELFDRVLGISDGGFMTTPINARRLPQKYPMEKFWGRSLDSVCTQVVCHNRCGMAMCDILREGITLNSMQTRSDGMSQTQCRLLPDTFRTRTWDSWVQSVSMPHGVAD
jgi:hypothetical protein